MSTTLLIVDEDSWRLQSRATYLRTCGYRVFSAANGNEALRMLDRGWFQAVCCVLHATSDPAADAEFLISKQSDARFAHIPVVLLADRATDRGPAPPPIRVVLPTSADPPRLASALDEILAAPLRVHRAMPSMFDDSETTDVG